ncbi:MAG: hypothetical protein QOJ51_634 [Acidobacteriaceae bacterium]|jgi:hypothetical protein|nr:hypothetical protein [Acidobacteriaceae bacterium]
MLPDGVEEQQDWMKCPEPTCERHYSPSHGYFSLRAQRIVEGSTVRHLCQSEVCNAKCISMGLVSSEGNARKWHCFGCKASGKVTTAG